MDGCKNRAVAVRPAIVAIPARVRGRGSPSRQKLRLSSRAEVTTIRTGPVLAYRQAEKNDPANSVLKFCANSRPPCPIATSSLPRSTTRSPTRNNTKASATAFTGQ